MEAIEIKKKIEEMEKVKENASGKDKERIGDMIGLMEQLFEDKKGW